MTEMYLRQPGFTWSVYGTFIRHKEGIQKFKETGDWRYIYQYELDKSCFQQDMAYSYFKYLTRRTASDKILCDNAFNITKNPKYDEYQRDLASMYITFLIKKTSAMRANKFAGNGVKNTIISNKESVEELHRPIT